MTVVFTLCFVLLSVAAALVLYRLARGPSVPDRIIALDVVLQIVVAGIAVGAATTGSGPFLAVLIAVALLGFVGSVTVARYVERRGS